MQVVECVPNFSEGRDEAVITAIVRAISEAGVNVLDVSSDVDHNRTVVTFTGEPQTVVDGALRGVRVAAERIDLRQHRGVHPRIGATDVVPLIPLRNVSMFECIGLARELGQRIGDELGLPVYLYESAAIHPERTNLADIRRGEYEGLQARIDRDPQMQPDFGPARVGKAGAVVVGTRGPLIAFNAYLNTDDVTLARQIARAIRESSGGLPHVKAIGLLVKGQAQVSMNILDYRQTGLYAIVEAVRHEAMKVGLVVERTELIGLAPQMALIEAALAYLGLPAGAASQLLEPRLGAVYDDYREIVFE